MTGCTYEDMNAARKGESHYHVAEVSEGELSDVRKIFNRKRRKEYGME
jgi:hypothetical protein